ncbi:MAG: hypothetical protein ISR84_03665 [Kiritimatiellales bacterium]|nr:hypothetical protein [Kiritimatiellota bacterium]MBL7016635.1 hypothetical protein [Kiritimatiellales bacterium]
MQSYLLRATLLGFVAPIGLLIYLFPSVVRPVDGILDWAMAIGAGAAGLFIWIYVTFGLLKVAVVDPLRKDLSKPMRRFLWVGFGLAVLLLDHAFIVLDTDDFSRLYWCAWLAINFAYVYIFLTKNLICGFCLACVLMPLAQDKFNLIMISGLIASYLILLTGRYTGVFSRSKTSSENTICARSGYETPEAEI